MDGVRSPLELPRPLARVKHPLGRGVVVPLLEGSNWSNRQIAAVAGVDPETVNRAARAAFAAPRAVLGADNKVYAPRIVQTDERPGRWGGPAGAP